MDKDKEKLEISVIGRLLSIEALLLLMGGAMLVSGAVTAQLMQMFLGGIIVAGSLALLFVRNKGCRKQDQLQGLNEQSEGEQKENNDTGKG